MNPQTSLSQHTIATCPACGLVCDDVQPTHLNCSKGVVFFQQPMGTSQAKIKGKQATMAQAVEEASRILKQADFPLFSGLSTDVEGFRALYQLADKSNATFAHVNNVSIARNMRVLQSAGWQTTTLTEVKNRTDLLICIGTDIVAHNPRFFERFIWAKQAMFVDTAARDIVYIGDKRLDISAGTSPTGKHPTFLQCAKENIPEVIAVIHALALGKPLKANKVAGIASKDLEALIAKIKQAKYTVFAWIAKDLDFPHAELTIQQITQTVAVLNQSTRVAALPLGGSDGDTSVNYAHTWLSGLALSNEPTDITQHDAQLWVNSFNAEKLPEKSNAPLIVLGNPNTQFKHKPDVFIPVATPGIDCAGTLFRIDSSVTLPLKKLRDSALPTLAEVAQRIGAKL